MPPSPDSAPSNHELLVRIDERTANLLPWVASLDRRVNTLEAWKNYALGASGVIALVWAALKLTLTVGHG